MRNTALIAALAMTGVLGCGPNVLSAKGTVMNPLVKDSDEFAFIRRVTIVRKEPNVRNENTIVGDYRRPLLLGELHETAEIPKQVTDGSGLLITFEIFSPYKDELVGLTKNYTFWLELPDGRKIKGEPHRVWALRDLTEKVTGGSMRTHQVVIDKRAGTATALRHWEEVENEYQLFWRKIRVVFKARDLITMETPKIVAVVRGERRVRRYTFVFTTDPTDLMDKDEKRGYLEAQTPE